MLSRGDYEYRISAFRYNGPIPEVDMAVGWYVGGTVFMAWFAVLASIGNFLFVRVSTQFSLRRTILAVFAMTGISWLFVAAFPFPLYASMVIFQLCGHQYPPIGWLIVPVLLSSLMAAFVGVTVLVGFHQKRTLSNSVAICESHMYRDFVLSHDDLCVTCPHSGMTNQSWRTGRLLENHLPPRDSPHRARIRE